MAASTTMPYFIKASQPLNANEKHEAYEQLVDAVQANLEGEDNMILKMSTISCLLKTYLPYCYWVGFYIMDQGKLKVGPYQGTLGCLHIDLDRGVCGRCASEKRTQIVDNVHLLQQGTAHIACDPNSQSEIVVPVFNAKGHLIAVLDIDSTLEGSFDRIDKQYLEALLDKHFSHAPLSNYSL